MTFPENSPLVHVFQEEIVSNLMEFLESPCITRDVIITEKVRICNFDLMFLWSIFSF